MALQAKRHMKFTLNWIIVNLTEFLLIPQVSLQHGGVLGYRAEFFRALFLILRFSLSGFLAHCGGLPPISAKGFLEKIFFAKGLWGGVPP